MSPITEKKESEKNLSLRRIYHIVEKQLAHQVPEMHNEKSSTAEPKFSPRRRPPSRGRGTAKI